MDLHLASFLYCRGAALLGCVRLRPKKYLFHFRADQELHALLRVYWNRTLTPVIPSLLLDTPQRLKSRALDRPTGATIAFTNGGGEGEEPPSSITAPPNHAEH